MRTARLALLVLPWLTACSLFSEPKLSTHQFVEESKNYADLHIVHADYQVRPSERRLAVEADLRLVNSGTTPINEFKFYVAWSARHLGIFRDGQKVSYERSNNSRYQKVLALTAVPPIAPGEAVAYRITYSYEPPVEDQGSNCRLQPGATHVYDSLWVPRIQPGEDRPFDQFPYSMTIDVPEDETPITNGALVSIEPLAGAVRYRYVSEQPAHPFVVIGRYHTVEIHHGETTLTAYVHERYGDHGLERGRQYLQFIAGLLDVYQHAFGAIHLPRFRLISIDSDRANFGLTAGMLLSERHFRDHIPDGARLCVVAHELAHAWWANHIHSYGPGSGLVTEAMCNYAAAIGFGALFGADAERELYATYREFYKPVATEDIPLGRQDGYQEIYYTSTYNRGALILRMLESQLGRERFHAILRDFVATHGGESVQAQTFLDFIQANSTQDLSAFFDEFIWSTALPDYRVAIVANDSTEGGSTVTVTNDGTGRFPVIVRMQGDQGEVKEDQVCLGYRASQELKAPFVVAYARVDPDNLLVQSNYGNDAWPRNPATLSGRTTRAGEKLTSPARIQIWRKGALPQQFTLVREVNTDNEGRFSVGNLSPDRYLITVRAPNCVPHHRTIELKRSWSVEIVLEPVIDVAMLGFTRGAPLIHPLGFVGHDFVPAGPPPMTPQYLILNRGRKEEMVVLFAAVKRIPIFPGSVAAAADLDVGDQELRFDPATLGDLKLAAMISQDTLRASLLEPGWYQAAFLP